MCLKNRTLRYFDNKTVVFAAKYQMKWVTVAIVNCASFHSLCCLMNRKGKSFKQCFYRNNKNVLRCQRLQQDLTVTGVRMLSVGIDAAHDSFATYSLHRRCSKSDPKICCSGVASRYGCYGNHTAGSKPIYKLFIVFNGELNKASLRWK